MANPTVTIEIKEIGAAEVIRRMRKVRQEAGKLAGAKKRLAKGTKKAGDATKEAGKKIGKFSELMRDLETNAVLALGPLSGVGARVRAIGVLARRGNIAMIAFSLGLAAVAGAAVLLVTALIKVRLALDPIEGRLRAVTGSAIVTRLELRRLVDLAFDLGLDLQATAEGFSQLAAAARGTSLEGEGIRKVFEAIAKASAALRLGAEQTEGVIRALEQALTKGILRAEEFNQQLGDRLPGASRLAANALNVTTIEFQKMLKAGEIITEEFLPKLAEELEKIFSAEAQRNVETLQGSMSQLKTAFTEFFDVLEARIGLAEKIAKVFNKIAENIRELTGAIDTPLARATRSIEDFQESITIFELKGILEERKGEIRDEFIGIREELDKQLKALVDRFSKAPKFIEMLRDFFGVEGKKLPLDRIPGFAELSAVIAEIDKALAKLEDFQVREKGVIPPPDITKIQGKFDKIVRGAETAGAAMRRLLAGDLLGAEFEVSLGKAGDILAKFGEKTIVEFARVNKVVSQSLIDAFEKGDPVASAKAYVDILLMVEQRFAGLIQTAKDFKTLGKIFDDTRTPLERFNIEMEKLLRLMQLYPDQIDSIERAMSKLRSNLFKTSEEGKFLKKAFEEIGSSMVDAFADGKNMIEALRDTLNDLLKDLLKLLIRLTIINPLINSVFGLKPGGGALPTLGTGLFGSFFGGGAGATAGAGSAFAGLPFVPMQHGGSFTVGGAGGPDSKLFPLKLTPREKVRVTRPGQDEGGNTFVMNFNFPPGTNVREFAESQKQIAAMAANTLASASASNN